LLKIVEIGDKNTCNGPLSQEILRHNKTSLALMSLFEKVVREGACFWDVLRSKKTLPPEQQHGVGPWVFGAGVGDTREECG